MKIFLTVLLSIVGLVLLLLLAVALLYVFYLLRPKKVRRITPELERLMTDYAHRGLHGTDESGRVIPENSLAAFARAADHGFGMELDVYLSKDEEVVVLHDGWLERMTGVKGDVSQYTAEELDKMRLAGTDEKLPRLREVLALVDGRTPLLVELKGENLKLCPKVDALLSNYKGDYCIESFNPLLLGWYAKNRPEIFRGMLVSNTVGEWGKFKLKDVGFRNLMLTTLAFNYIARPNFIAYYQHHRNLFSIKLCTEKLGAVKFSWTQGNIEEYNTARANGEFAIFEGFIPEKR